MRRALILVFLVLAMPLHTAIAAERWEALPPTPDPVPGLQSGHAKLNGIRPVSYTHLTLPTKRIV